MAVADAKHTPLRWTVSAPEWSVTILCPKYIAALLANTLTGWTIAPCDTNARAAIHVHHTDGQYDVDADVLRTPQHHSDLIDALNEVFVCLAYLVTGTIDGAVLLHCAAYGAADRCQIVVGDKNTGKSTRAYHQAYNGISIAADDLLIWTPKQGTFRTLGLPIRMRRPVLSPSGALADPDKFFAGRHITYARKGAFDVMPAGQTLILDHLWKLGPNHTATQVSILKIPTTLNQHLIDADFLTLKKQLMDD